MWKLICWWMCGESNLNFERCEKQELLGIALQEKNIRGTLNKIFKMGHLSHTCKGVSYLNRDVSWSISQIPFPWQSALWPHPDKVQNFPFHPRWQMHCPVFPSHSPWASQRGSQPRRPHLTPSQPRSQTHRSCSQRPWGPQLVLHNAERREYGEQGRMRERERKKKGQFLTF